MARVDFSRNAAVYDRRHGAVLQADAARRLVDAASLSPGRRILDVGAGSGRVAIALAALGSAMVALEPSRAMLAELHAKAAALPIASAVGEGGRLPFVDASFDAVVLARVMYLMSDWRTVLREATRVVGIQGRLLHEWANGSDAEPWAQIKEKARSLFEEAGVAAPFHPGARLESDVDLELARLGWIASGEVSLGAGPEMTLETFLARIVSGECSYVWSVPDAVQRRTLPALTAWAAERFDLQQPKPMPRELTWKIFRQAPSTSHQAP